MALGFIIQPTGTRQKRKLRPHRTVRSPRAPAACSITGRRRPSIVLWLQSVNADQIKTIYYALAVHIACWPLYIVMYLQASHGEAAQNYKYY